MLYANMKWIHLKFQKKSIYTELAEKLDMNKYSNYIKSIIQCIIQ